MKEFHDRRRFKKLLHSRYAIAVLAIAAVVVARGAWGIYGKYERSREIEARAQSELSDLRLREAELVAAIAKLDTEEGREREIRDRFGAVKEGERLVVLVSEEADGDQIEKSPEPGFWAKFFEALGF